MKLLTENTAIPRRKRKPKPTPFDSYEPFLKLKAMVLNKKMQPGQQIGILFDSHDAKELGMKWPWRTCADRVRKLLRDTGLDNDYGVTKYETDTPGVWFVKVTHHAKEKGERREPTKRASRA